jgi:hypothetical protein
MARTVITNANLAGDLYASCLARFLKPAYPRSHIGLPGATTLNRS